MYYHEEEKARIDNFEIPIQCIVMTIQHKPESLPPQSFHFHDYIEILYGLDSDALVWCGSECLRMKNGDMIIINSGTPHAITTSSDKSSYIVIKFMPQILYAAEQSVFEFKYILPFISDSGQYGRVFSEEELHGSGIPQVMSDIMDEWNKKDYGFELALRMYVIKIVLWLIRRMKSNRSFSPDETRDAMRAVQKSIEYAHNEFSTATSCRAAELCGLSAGYFSRLFKRMMNKSFTEYVNYIRISEAERMLLTTDKRITDIALDTGFSTTSYFIQMFKAHTHLTPKQFRSASIK